MFGIYTLRQSKLGILSYRTKTRAILEVDATTPKLKILTNMMYVGTLVLVFATLEKSIIKCASVCAVGITHYRVTYYREP
jgi:hypothetical protein